jgi:hypothetical protein
MSKIKIYKASLLFAWLMAFVFFIVTSEGEGLGRAQSNAKTFSEKCGISESNTQGHESGKIFALKVCETMLRLPQTARVMVIMQVSIRGPKVEEKRFNQKANEVAVLLEESALYLKRQVVSGALFKEQMKRLGRNVADDDISKIGKSLGASHAILGFVEVIASEKPYKVDQIQIILKILDVASGNVIDDVQFQGLDLV